MVPPEGMDQIEAPQRIVLTNRHHYRDSDALRLPGVLPRGRAARVRRRPGGPGIRVGGRARARRQGARGRRPLPGGDGAAGRRRARVRRRRDPRPARGAGVRSGLPARRRPAGGPRRACGRRSASCATRSSSTPCCSPTASRSAGAGGRHCARSPTRRLRGRRQADPHTTGQFRLTFPARLSRVGFLVRRVLVLTVFALALACAPAHAQTLKLEPPFGGSYSLKDLGPPPGVPTRLGGLTLKAGTTDRLLIGGEADGVGGALYEVRVVRNSGGHISGFAGNAKRFADAAYNDGGVTYGPGNVLFLARWPVNQLGQTKPGSTATDKLIDVGPFGVASSLVGLGFVPPGQPGAGRLKLVSYSGGEWYDAGVAPDGSGTYNLVDVTNVPGSTLSGGVVGFTYVNAGSRQFSGPSMLVSEYSADGVAAYARRRQRQPDPVHPPPVRHRARRRRRRVHRSGHRRLPVLDLRRRRPRRRRPRVRRLGAAAGGRQERQRAADGRDRQGQAPRPERLPEARRDRPDPGRHHGRRDQGAGRARRRAAAREASFYAGVFKFGQTKGAKPLTTLKLVGKLSARREGLDGGEGQEEAAPVGRRQGPLPHAGQAQRGDRASARSGSSRIAAARR